MNTRSEHFNDDNDDNRAKLRQARTLLCHEMVKSVLTLLIALPLAACGGNGSSSVADDEDLTTHALIDIPLTVITRNSGGGKGLALNLGIGGASGVGLLVDTGSCGVHVLTDDIQGADVQRTGKQIIETYADGTQLVGEEAMAAVQIGKAVSKPIAIHLVDKVTCTSNQPNCSGSSGSDFFHATGVRGIVGIALANNNAEPNIFSPLAQLPDNLSSGYIIHTNGYDDAKAKLTIGLSPATRKHFKTVPLARQQEALPNGRAAWDDAKIDVCYSLDDSPIQNECGISIFDTGATAIFWKTSRLTNDKMDGFGNLRAGSHFRASIKDVFNWNFVVGSVPVPGRDMVISSPNNFNTNLGIGVFFSFDVMYDAKQGALGLRPRA